MQHKALGLVRTQSWKKILGVVGEESGVLGLHGPAPVRVGKGSPVGARNWRQSPDLVDGGHVEAALAARPHAVLVG